MNYAVEVRQDHPAADPVRSHALSARYPTIEAAARAGRCEARRQARRSNATFEFKVIDFLGRFTTGGIVRRDPPTTLPSQRRVIGGPADRV